MLPLFLFGDQMVTTAEQLEAIEVAINTRLTGGAVSSYAIGNRNLKYETLESLMALKAQYLSIQAAENPSTNFVDFERPK